jgi:hypothetical protein
MLAFTVLKVFEKEINQKTDSVERIKENENIKHPENHQTKKAQY